MDDKLFQAYVEHIRTILLVIGGVSSFFMMANTSLFVAIWRMYKKGMALHHDVNTLKDDHEKEKKINKNFRDETEKAISDINSRLDWNNL